MSEPTVPEDPTGQVFVEADDAPTVPAEEVPSRGALRTAGVISGRVVLGCVTVAVLLALLAAAVLLPLPSSRSAAISTVVTPVPTTRQVVCPGGLLRIGSESGKGASTVSALGSPHLVTAAQPGDVVQSPFSATDAGTAGGAGAPMLLGTPAIVPGAAAPLLAGAQSESIKTGEFFGLASAECTVASGGSWLSGGATTVGRTTLLLLANPTAVPAVVSVQMFGENGQVTAPGMDGIQVGAGAQRVLSLAGFAPDLASPVVHVVSSGGQVVASLEQSTVRGVTPGGIDFVASTNAPALRTVLPGVVVSGTAALQALQGQSGFDDVLPTLRIFLPSTHATSATITILAENGTVTGKPIRAELQPESVTDFPLDQLSDGNYTVLVTSKVPVLASARVSTAAGGAAAPAATADASTAVGGDSTPTIPASSEPVSPSVTDFAWITPASLLTSSVLVPVVAGVQQPILHLQNPTSSAQTVTLKALTGANITKTVPAHRAVAIPLVAGRTYRLEGLRQLYASISASGRAQITSYGLSPLARGEGPVRVFG